MAREQVKHQLAWIARAASIATVWTWQDLWQEVRTRRGEGPIQLSDIAARAIRHEAIAKARVGGRLDAIGKVLDLPGYRKRIRDRISSWTRSGLDDESKPPKLSQVGEAEWRIFVTYRRLLARLGLNDTDGMASWASNILSIDPPLHFQKLHRLRVVEPSNARNPSIALQALSGRADDSQICLTIDQDRATLFRDQLSLRDRALGWGYEEASNVESLISPMGLDHVRRNLFCEPQPARSAKVEGISFLGSPEGDGEALVIAERVRDILTRKVAPEDIVLVPAQDSLLSQRVSETLADWGIAVESNRPIRLANDPSLSVLRLAATLPSVGWDADSLVDLFRHGRFRPEWPEASAPLALETAATAIRESRAYRGDGEIREAIRRVASAQASEGDPEAKSRLRRSARATLALPLVDRLVQTIKRLAQPGNWSICIDRLFLLADEIGLKDGRSLDALQIALEHHGSILRFLEKEREVWSWSAFIAEATSIIRELTNPPEKKFEATVKMVNVEDLSGASASHLILFGLTEGTFSSSADDQQRDSEDEPLAKEMHRFLTLCGVPNETLTLASPIVDAKGERLALPGFVEDVRRLFTPDELKRVTRIVPRIDGFLTSELAIAPNETRVRAVAQACLAGDFQALRTVAQSGRHRAPLEGTARALLLAHWRSRRGRFGRFDGRLKDPRIIEKLTREFSPDRRPFSASQLENLAECPFRYYMRYVLRIEETDERNEFEEDYADKGSMLHSALERLHEQIQSIADDSGRSVLERVEADVEAVFEQILSREREPSSQIEKGLLEIDSERLRRTARRYARQFSAYAAKPGRSSECQDLEISFGGPRDEHPALILGEGDAAIRLQGKIDRIDVVDRNGQSFFRIIDYKSGAIPTPKDIAAGTSLQLPLYVMAAERVLFVNGEKSALDAGYWGLKSDGFKPKRTMSNSADNVKTDVEAEWRAFSAELERYILALVERSRGGDFPVSPRKDHCDRYCDYRHVCRIKGSRRAPKTWDQSPTLGDPP